MPTVDDVVDNGWVTPTLGVRVRVCRVALIGLFAVVCIVLDALEVISEGVGE